jgi:hypothetical protein
MKHTFTERKKYSRLSSRERKRYARQTILFSLLTIILILVIIFWGVPALVKVALFLGDLRSSTQPIQNEDILPPSPPILQPLTDATSSASVRVEGFAEEGATVQLFVNEKKSAETITENNGEFVINSLPLSAGENQVYAVSIDPAGNKSQDSHIMKITYDAFPPTLEINSPKDRSSFYGNKERTVTITGKTEANAKIKINNNLVITSQLGEFSYQFTLDPGENEITVIAQDKAQNERAEKLKLTYSE